MQTWLDNGARLAWLIDPIAANVTICSPDNSPEIPERPDVVIAGDPVAGFELRCSPLWPAL